MGKMGTVIVMSMSAFVFVSCAGELKPLSALQEK